MRRHLSRLPLPRFRADAHDARTATVLGRLLGLAFAVCFLTGLASHLLQQPPAGFSPPASPAWGYRLTQGLHVATGLAAAPLLAAKLWSVYPRLFAWPPVRSLAHAAERLSIALLVAGSLFELVTGYLNTLQLYPWRFPFRQTHLWVAWITIGALLLHIAVKAPVIAAHWRRSRPPTPADGPTERQFAGGVSRRGLIAGVGAASAVVTAVTVGQSVTSLRRLDLLAPRSPDVGPQGLPINRTAAAAGVLTLARSPGWRLRVDGPRPYELTLDQLAALPQRRVRLPIACVEGWSVAADWDGVPLWDLLERAGAPAGARARVRSLEPAGSYRVMEMPASYARDPRTLLALAIAGEPLSIEHGYPARIIAPNRPGVLQTKWVARIEVLPA